MNERVRACVCARACAHVPVCVRTCPCVCICVHARVLAYVCLSVRCIYMQVFLSICIATCLLLTATELYTLNFQGRSGVEYGRF